MAKVISMMVLDFEQFTNKHDPPRNALIDIMLSLLVNRHTYRKSPDSVFDSLFLINLISLIVHALIHIYTLDI